MNGNTPALVANLERTATLVEGQIAVRRGDYASARAMATAGIEKSGAATQALVNAPWSWAWQTYSRGMPHRPPSTSVSPARPACSRRTIGHSRTSVLLAPMTRVHFSTTSRTRTSPAMRTSAIARSPLYHPVTHGTDHAREFTARVKGREGLN